MDDLACDTYRIAAAFGRWATVRACLRDRSFRAIVTLRWCQSARGPLRLIARLLHRAACRRAGIDLPAATAIGGGFAITHGWGLVVNGQARIGRNVTMFHGATLGQADRIARDGSRIAGFPMIGDDVWIGPHAVIVGAVSVGTGARILANSVVTEDVPPRALVGGNPAQVLREDVVEDVENKVPGLA